MSTSEKVDNFIELALRIGAADQKLAILNSALESLTVAIVASSAEEDKLALKQAKKAIKEGCLITLEAERDYYMKKLCGQKAAH